MAEANRREQILAVALELLLSKGFANVSTRDLAERAGLSRSHIYHYFKDWPTLRQEAFTQFANAQIAEARVAVADLPPREALRLLIRQCLPQHRDNGLVLWLDAWDEALHDPDLATIYTRIDAEWAQLIADIIERGVEAGTFRNSSAIRSAHQIFALTMGYADRLLLNPSDQTADGVFEEVCEVADLLLGRR